VNAPASARRARRASPRTASLLAAGVLVLIAALPVIGVVSRHPAGSVTAVVSLLVVILVVAAVGLVVAAPTLAAAALFSPVRRRVQRAVDRRFNRARYDADAAVAAFAGRLQDAADLDAVGSDLLASVAAALEPAHVSVWLDRDRVARQ
jgi:hypothetical protein